MWTHSLQGSPLLFAGLAALAVAGCGSSGLGVVEGSTGSPGAQSAARLPHAGAASTTITSPTVSHAEMKRFLAKQLVENLFIGTQIVRPKREIISASIYGPVKDTGWLASPEDDNYCVTAIVKNFDMLQKEKQVTVLFWVHQLGNILSARTEVTNYKCKPDASAFPEAVELSLQRNLS